jgi:uncharacterized phage protein (TIGR01671 family)
MNRIIKFRVWEGGIRRMASVEKLEFNGDKVSKIVVHDGFTAPHDDEEDYLESTVLMQFTGLVDKNGVEIYEEDIVIPAPEKDQYVNFDKSSVIRWHDSGWFIYEDENKPTPPFHITRLQTPEHFGVGVEVIGNIYENSELLGSSNN